MKYLQEKEDPVKRWIKRQTVFGGLFEKRYSRPKEAVLINREMRGRIEAFVFRSDGRYNARLWFSTNPV